MVFIFIFLKSVLLNPLYLWFKTYLAYRETMSQTKETVEGFNYVQPETEAASYIEYLKSKYKTIEVLNEACKTIYASFDALVKDRPSPYEKLDRDHLLWSVIRKEKFDKDHQHWDEIRNSGLRNRKCSVTVNDFNDDFNDDFIVKDCVNQLSSLYVVMSNENPIFYTKSREEARLRMEKMAKILKTDYNDEYRCNIVYKTLDSMQIIGNYKNYLVSYDSVLERLDVKLVPHCSE